jgi:hypothetical protein
MAGKCSICDEPCTFEESTCCKGPCNRIIHYACTGMPKTVQKFLVDYDNLSFTCDPCLLKCYKPLENKVDALEENVNSLRTLVTSLLNRTSHTQSKKTLTTKSITIGDSPSENEVFFSPPPATNPKIPAANKKPGRNITEILGTGPLSENITLAEPRFWMYLSGLDPSTEECDINDYVKSVFQCDSIKTKKLLPTNRDPDTCEFVSFKIGFPLNMKERAMDPDFWPTGIKIREFNDRIKTKKNPQRSRLQSRGTENRPPMRPRSRSRPHYQDYHRSRPQSRGTEYRPPMRPRSRSRPHTSDHHQQSYNSNFRTRHRSQSTNRNANYGRQNSYRQARYY